MVGSKGRFPHQTGRNTLDRFRPGHLFWVAAGATWLNRDKPRPFVLATECSRGGPGTLVYGSTQETEKQLGAACIEVPPIREGLNRNHLRATTYFYPGTLLLTAHRELPPHAGFLGKSVDDLKQALRRALGIGQGSCMNAGMTPGSRRGRIIELSPAVASDLLTPFAVVLTEHRYSRSRKYQVIVPILRAFAKDAGNHDLVISSRPWIEVFSEPVKNVLLPIPITHSVWDEDDIARETEHVVDDETLHEIDRRLCDYFALAPVDAG